MIDVDTFATMGEAAQAMNADSSYLGGGTLVMRALNYGEQDFTRIVRSSDPALRQIQTAGDRLVIGAGVTMEQVIKSGELSFLLPVAKAVGGPAVRSAATVGGNLFAEHPYGDFTVALLALNGQVKMASSQEQDLAQFLSNRRQVNDLVASVSIARPAPQDFKWKKVSRVKPKGVSVMSIAAWLPQSGGRISQARIAFGAMGETPLLATSAQAALEGQSLDAQSVAQACTALRSDFQPPDDALASSWYRSEVAPVHLRRLLLNEEAA